MTDTRPIVQLHTIDQWLATDPAIRVVILQNIKLKDRLQRYLSALNNTQGSTVTESHWVRCGRCSSSGHPGYILKEPRYDGIHPSQIVSPCMKKIYFDMTGESGQENIEPRVRLIFDLGHAIHHMFQTYGLNGAWGPHYKHEVEISGKCQQIAADYMIEGHADADNILTIDDIPGSPYVYEVGLVHEYKSINDNGYSKLKSAKPDHKAQAIIYAKALNRPIVVYLYLNKNDQNLADFPVAFDPVMWERSEGKIKSLLNYYDSKTPPPGEVGFHCRDCKYLYICEDYRAAQPRR
jgi:CRISPR/Cas system-associated exonuclease Cas4 (RecB family)